MPPAEKRKAEMRILCFALMLLLMPTLAFSQPPSGDPLAEMLDRLTSVENRVKKIEAHQQEILARQEKILAELDRIRVWVHRR